jgi:hypothetical protein
MVKRIQTNHEIKHHTHLTTTKQTNHKVEANFLDGTKLVAVVNPICRTHGDLALALEGSFLPVPALSAFDAPDPEEGLVLGEVVTLPDEQFPLLLNKGREIVTMSVFNTADRPIQVGSHYHFIETNPYLRFDRLPD